MKDFRVFADFREKADSPPDRLSTARELWESFVPEVGFSLFVFLSEAAFIPDIMRLIF